MDRIIKTDKGIGTINTDYLGDTPYQKNPENVQKYNPLTYANIPGVRNTDKICMNKSDFRPVTKSERG